MVDLYAKSVLNFLCLVAVKGTELYKSGVSSKSNSVEILMTK